MNAPDLLHSAAETLNEVRNKAPLVHNITNYVVMNSSANALLAIGASPVMAHAEEEIEDISALSSSLVINIGTLSELWIESMMVACEFAADSGKELILDPVGAGATAYRTTTALDILEIAGSCTLRGNASEIAALAGEGMTTKGVDSSILSEAAISAAKKLSEREQTSVIVSGATDYILHDGKIFECRNGHSMMTKVTGLGCTATAILGAFIGACGKSAEALIGATLTTAIAGEIAAENSKGSGSFAVAFLDALSNMTPEIILNRAKLSC